MKHYVVTAGSYSDYHIIAVCSNKEDAEKIKNKFSYDPYDLPDIEEYTEGKEVFLNQNSYFVRLSENGEIIHFKENESEYSWENSGPRNGGNNTTYMYVLAKDEEHARKIAADRWAQWRAMQEGLC